MDRIISGWNEIGPFEDEGIRMKTRPSVASGPENQGLRRKGQAVEDLGSGFIKKGAVGKSRRRVSPKGSQTSILRDFTDSEDEMDMLSQHSAAEASGKEDLLLGPDGKVHEAHPDFPSFKAEALKKIKFKKNKTLHDSATAPQRSDASSSVLPVLQENANVQRPGIGPMSKSVAKPQRTASQTSATRPRSPSVRTRRKLSPNPNPNPPSTRDTKPPQEVTTSENTRPKPRPLGKPRVASQLQPAPFPNLDPPSSPRRRRNTVSVTENDGARSTNHTLTPAPFPMVSPVLSPPRPAKFPTLPALGPHESKQKTKPLRPHSSVKQPIAQAEPAKTAKAKKPQVANGYPVLSPLSSQTKATSNGRKTSSARKKSSNRVVSCEEESEVEINGVLRPQPFPMNTQVLGSIGFPCTPTVAGPSRPGKRLSSDRNSSGSERENKKTRKDNDIIMLPLGDYDYEEDDTIRMSPTRDPRTICPYCDAPMPRSPTPLLTQLLASTALKSKPQARPGNPMGRKAPFTTFIGVCQRHRFETKILPEAEAKGWPKSIEWTKLEGRVSRMKAVLQELIEDLAFEPDSDEDDLFSEDTQGSKARCIFWKEVINEVKQKGSRAVAGVRGQFANFEKTQPGYYGERGSVIIHQTLYDLFPPISIDPSHVAPLTPNEFLQRILVPEVGVRLIMEDNGLIGNEGVKCAVQILRDSASYGVAMFPEDGGEWGKGEGSHDSDGNDDELGVADLIVMERARKRRKELEEEDEREEEELRLKQKQTSLKEKERERVKERKGKEAVSQLDLPAALPPVSRPRPRPFGKGSSGISDSACEMDGLGSSQARTSVETTDDESEDVFYSKSKRSLRLSPTVNDFYLKPDYEQPTRRVTRSVSRSVSVDVDLCSSSENTNHNEAPLKAQPRKANKKRNRVSRKANTRSSRSEGSDSNPIVDSPLATPATRRSNHDRQADVDMEHTPMPPSRPRFPPAPGEGQPSVKMHPSQRTKERKKMRYAGGAVDQTPRARNQASWRANMRDEPQDSSPGTRPNSPDSHSWLLSD